MQAKVVGGQSYSGDLDYITMPLSSDRSRAKIMMPATKEIMEESTRRKVKKNESFSTPGGFASRDRKQGDYLNMTSSSSDKKSQILQTKEDRKKEKRKKAKKHEPLDPAEKHLRG